MLALIKAALLAFTGAMNAFEAGAKIWSDNQMQELGQLRQQVADLTAQRDAAFKRLEDLGHAMGTPGSVSGTGRL